MNSNSLTDRQLAAVADWLRANGTPVDAPLAAELIAGGRSNLTYRLSGASTRWILRTPPRAGQTPSAHDVAREYRVTAALVGTEVPVAPVVALCEDPSVIGAPFSVVTFVPGLTVRSRADLDALDDAAVAGLTARLAETLAALHRVDYAAVGLAGFGRPDGYAQRQLRRWSQQWELVGTPPLAFLAEQVRAKLSARLPQQRATSIVHGDFRVDNAILRVPAGGPPEIAAVVDWELSTIGDPVADVAMMCAYRDSAFDLIVGEASAWTSPRLPDEAALAAAYEAAGGMRLAEWDAHMALAYFKIAVIAAGIDHRWRAGAVAGAGFDTAGQSVVRYLELGLARLG